MSKKYDIAVKVGEYTNGHGEKKNRYMNVGAVIQGDNGPYILMERTFNPAGVPGNEGKATVLLSLFAPKEERKQETKPEPSKSGGGFDDDIPF